MARANREADTEAGWLRVSLTIRRTGAHSGKKRCVDSSFLRSASASSNGAAEKLASEFASDVEKRLREATDRDGEQDASQGEGFFDVLGERHRMQTDE